MESIKDLKYKIDLIDYLCSEEHILTVETNKGVSNVRKEQEEQEEDTREPEHWYPFCYF